jgi:hypothetical protein
MLAAALLAIATPQMRAQSGEFREITWDDLMPPDWDPMKAFEGIGNPRALVDGDPRTEALMKRIRDIWDGAPTVPSLAGQSVRLAGYLVPLEEDRSGTTEFLLVPYFGACIHTPPPPANQIVHVRSARPVTGFRTMEAVWVHGTIDIERSPTEMGVSGYTMKAQRVIRY